jgi:hypothetical protein
MKITLLVLQVMASLSGIASICCVAGFCVGQFLALRESRLDDFARLDNWGWAGLILFTLWMACQIGTIGL